MALVPWELALTGLKKINVRNFDRPGKGRRCPISRRRFLQQPNFREKIFNRHNDSQPKQGSDRSVCCSSRLCDSDAYLRGPLLELNREAIPVEVYHFAYGVLMDRERFLNGAGITIGSFPWIIQSSDHEADRKIFLHR